MRGMQRFGAIALVFGLLAGCSGGDPAAEQPPGPDEARLVENAEPGTATDLDSAALWADALIAAATHWEATTPRPVAITAAEAALCRETRPASVYGPHGRHAYWVRVNPDGAAAFAALDTMPVGSVIVKEKHYFAEQAQTHATPTALGVMIKRAPGYDPDHGDWEYAYITLDADGAADQITRGQIATCIDCHTNNARHDYLYRNYLDSSIPRLE
ncbi:cytochrome P460 family protein [Phycisphaeraceae bacterium D3-23]